MVEHSLLKKTFAMRCHDDVNQFVIENFNDKLPIKYYSYAKLFSDGTRIYLSNLQQWLEHFFTNYSDDGLTSAHYSHYSNFYLICDNHFSFYKKMYDFDLSNILLIAERHKDYTEIHFFATSSKESNAIQSSYFEFKEVFRRFTLYFRENAYKIIEKALPDRLILPPANPKLTQTLAYELGQQQEKTFLHQKLINNLNVKGYPIVYRGISSHLTQREYECLIKFMQGLTGKEIARNLNISHRTVEHHISNVREKTQISTKAEIIECLLENNLIEIKSL
jgi:DNA-binding CsgD family transcriptional regulator